MKGILAASAAPCIAYIALYGSVIGLFPRDKVAGYALYFAGVWGVLPLAMLAADVVANPTPRRGRNQGAPALVAAGLTAVVILILTWFTVPHGSHIAAKVIGILAVPAVWAVGLPWMVGLRYGPAKIGFRWVHLGLCFGALIMLAVGHLGCGILLNLYPRGSHGTGLPSNPWSVLITACVPMALVHGTIAFVLSLGLRPRQTATPRSLRDAPEVFS